MRLRSVLGLYCEKSTPVERLHPTEDAVELRFMRRQFWFFNRVRLPQIGMAGDACQFLGDLSRRQHKISRAELSAGAARHVGILGAFLILRERDAALGLDGRQAQRPVRAGAGKNHPDGLAFPVLRQGAEKNVDHQPVAINVLDRPRGENPILHRQSGIGRDHVDVIGQQRRIITRFRHGHFGHFGEQLAQHAFVCLAEMGNQHESHARVVGKRFQEFAECFQSSSRSADADHRDSHRQGHGRPWSAGRADGTVFFPARVFAALWAGFPFGVFFGIC